MTKVMGTLAFAEACQRVLKYCPDEYAKAYAKRGLGMTDLREISSQAAYILSNTRYWRGEQAKIVKPVLKHFASIY